MSQYGLLRPSLRAAIERENDPDSLTRRTISQPGQVATNVGGSALAGLLGQVSDAARQASIAGPILSAMTGGKVSTSPFGQPRVPTTEEAQGLLGVEKDRPESMLGLLGAPDVQDIGRLAAMAGGKGLLNAMTLFHGTPHKFDMFDMKKIGTGEGAQAYGHGLYFAENPDVARWYQRSTSPTDRYPLINGIETTGPDWEKQLRSVVPGNYSRKDAGEALRLLHSSNRNLEDAIKEAGNKNLWPDGVEGFLKSLRDKEVSWPDKSSFLYEVDIPDETIAKMLDWDAPLSEQPEIDIRLRAMIGDDAVDEWQDMTGEQLYRTLSDSNVPSNMRDRISGDEVVSKELAEAGIPGIRYFDGGSRAAGEGTRNIVVFDPQSSINQVKRDGEIVFSRQ